jgi:hypothetical protein
LDKATRQFLAAKIRETLVSEIPIDGFANATLQNEISRDILSLATETDPLSNKAFHLLMHFIADEDIRSKDTKYAASQIEALEKIASELEQ